jgi:hypothetical protein
MASEAVPQKPEMTGATLVMFEPGQKPKDIGRVINNAVGVRTVHSSDFKNDGAAIAEAIEKEPAFSLDKLGIAVIAAPDGNGAASTAAALAATKGVRAARPEF